jgi:GPI-anchor transamidase subunit T
VSRSIAEIFLHYPINELHVSLTNSVFRYKQWGYPVVNAAPGSEILAWFEESAKDIDYHWKQLCGTLSGLLCASLSFVDETNTNSPIHSFKPTNNAQQNANSSFVRYAQLPREIVCTENLTPWKKLLPCDHYNGLASLLRSENLYTTSYNSMGIHVRKLCTEDKECEKFTLEVKQTINAVHDLQLFGGADWSIRKLFSQGIHGVCDLATSSKIYLDMTDMDFSISPKPLDVIKTTRGGAETTYGVYDLNALNPKGKMFNLAAVSERDRNILPILAPPPIYTKRFLLGELCANKISLCFLLTIFCSCRCRSREGKNRDPHNKHPLGTTQYCSARNDSMVCANIFAHTSLNRWRYCDPTHRYQIHSRKTTNPALPLGGGFPNSGASHSRTFH